MASQLLNWYEEGTWTPTDASGAGLTFTISGTPRYTRIGRQVTVTCYLTYPVTTSSASANIGGLPFAAPASGDTGFGMTTYNDSGNQWFLRNGSTTSMIGVTVTNTTVTNVSLSNHMIGLQFIYTI